MKAIQQLRELERSWFKFDDAKELLLSNVEQQIRKETAVMIRPWKREAKEEADKRPETYIKLFIQKQNGDVVSETTVSLWPFPMMR